MRNDIGRDSNGKPVLLPQACLRCRLRTTTICNILLTPGDGRAALNPSHVDLQRGDTLFCEGDAARYAYVVASGVIITYKVMTDGRRMILGFLYPGDTLAEHCPETHAYSAEAATTATVCLYARDSLAARAQHDPAVARRLLRSAHDSLSLAREQMVMLANMSARERVAHFLLRMSATAARRGGSATVLWLPFSRMLIGDHLGLTMETVSRTMTNFRRNKVIAVNGSEIELCDLSALSKLGGLPAPNPMVELLPAV